MPLTPWLYGLAALLLCQAVNAACLLAHALVGRAFGMRVREVHLGSGPVLLRRAVGDCRYCLRALPLGGFTQFHDRHDERPGDETASRFEDAPFVGQFL